MFKEFVECLLLAAFVLRRVLHLLTSLVEAALNSLALGIDYVFQPLLEVVHNGVHVVLLHLLAAPVLELLHQFPQPGHLLAVAVLHPLAHEVAQGLHDVFVVQDVLRKEVHQFIRVHIEDVLGSVPLGVPVGAK